MKAWQIFIHSLRQVIGNIGVALRVSAVPFAVLLVVGAGLGGLFLSAQMSSGATDASGMIWLALLVVFYVVVLMTVAVNWHRFVLMNEPVGWLPRFHGDRVVAYFLRGLIVSLVLLGIGLVLFLPVIFFGGAMGEPSALAVIVMIPIILLLATVGWRLSAAMPGAALEGGGGLADAWAATRGEWPTLLALTGIYFVASFVLSVIAAVLILIPVLGFLVQIAVNWLMMMVGLSVLTTLYGHYIEKRQLVA
ncbi:hypothetical protein E7811_07135 [Aliigemmobacter aestuarii]|uniref:Uncharacterized protein n=1 Tax=Aliigemmobacter aestuarii TaxID=1445661 RepID=A0A4S3MTG1_9RHOB|nr:hypothetical protein [Gemmobacter aestuarii]THD85464.1 hypothetical protein E7811_07135 [Gemmobacter aestuarii]